MGFLVACKNKEDPIIDEGARAVTTLFINFSDAHGQLTRSRQWNLGEIQTHPSFNSCPYCMQE